MKHDNQNIKCNSIRLVINKIKNFFLLLWKIFISFSKPQHEYSSRTFYEQNKMQKYEITHEEQNNCTANSLAVVQNANSDIIIKIIRTIDAIFQICHEFFSTSKEDINYDKS